MEIKDFENLAALARIAVTEDEKTAVLGKMNSVLDYIAVLNKAVADAQVDTDQFTLSPLVDSQSINVMREDIVTTEGGAYQEALVNAAPRHEKNYVKVKKILGGSQ